jgi:ADP-heptose:LPS heptosyltransferase
VKIIVRRKGALGDVLNTTPVVHRLRIENPEAWIAVETHHPMAYTGNPDVNLVTAPGHAGEADRFIDLDMSYERDRKRHRVAANMLVAFGDEAGDKRIRFSLPSKPPPVLQDWSRVIALHAPQTWESRTIAPAWWANLAAHLREAGFQPVSIGTFADPRIPGAIDTRGLLSLRETAGVIQASQLLICGDSAMFTLVGATTTPCIGLCTIARAEYFMPYRRDELGWRFYPIATSLACYGCSEEQPPGERYYCKRGDNACVSSFDVVAVAAQAVRMVRRYADRIAA